MKTTFVLGAAIVVLSTGAQSRNLLAFQPRATGTAILPDDGVSPKPTAPPGMDDFQRGLFKRVTTSEAPVTMMIAPNNTCGWISASVAVPFTCGSGATCGLVLAQKTFSGAVMCYNNMDYGFRFKCIDYSSYFSSSACDHLCAENAQTVKCTSSASPYCNTVAFPGGITDYWCNSVDYSTAQIAQTTWMGQTEPRSYIRFVQALSSSIDLASNPASGAPTATSTATAGESRTSGGSNGDDSGRRSKVPVGAIVGGVVGGVAAISLGVLAFFFFLRRKKSKAAEKANMPSSSQFPVQPMAFSGMPMTQTQVYSDPKFSGSPPPQGYPPQQQYSQNTPPPKEGYYTQQALSPSSPTASHMTDPRMSHMTASPTSTWTNAHGTPSPVQQPQPQSQPQQEHQPQGQQPQPHRIPLQRPIHEVPAETGDHHRGQMHEMA